MTTKSPQIRTFKSLNCSICNFPYSPTTTDPKSPLQLYCGATICRECYNREKPKSKVNRKHKCRFGDCFHLANPFYFLIDLLSSDSFAIYKEKNGYFLQKTLTTPECPICQEEYTGQTVPLLLFCNHTLCFDCFFKARKKSDIFGAQFTINCPLCQKEFGQVYDEVPLLKEFTEELPQMIDQLNKLSPFNLKSDDISNEKTPMVERTQLLNSIATTSFVVLVEPEPVDEFQCVDCQRKYQIEDMFFCNDCQKDICGACGLRSHRSHELKDFTMNEIKRLSEEVQETLIVQIATYEYLIPKIHSDLCEKISQFKKLILSKAGKVESKGHRVAKMEQKECKRIGDRFEAISEDYMPHLRTYYAKLQETIVEISDKSEEPKASNKV